MNTVKIDTDIAQYAGLVGRTVTYRDQPWKIHSVEGVTWYAFQDGDVVKIDQGMSPGSWLRVPRVMIHPVGTKIGEGFGMEIDLPALLRLDLAPLQV
jgi:hypothetical protein